MFCGGRGGARALVHPLTGRHLYAWRRLGDMLGADHKSVQRWHGQAIKMIHAALAKDNYSNNMLFCDCPHTPV